MPYHLANVAPLESCSFKLMNIEMMVGYVIIEGKSLERYSDKFGTTFSRIIGLREGHT